MSRGAPGHGGRVLEAPGPIADDETEPCKRCPTHDANDAAFRVLDPGYSFGTTTPMCAYHLACFKAEHPRLWGKLVRRDDHDGLLAAVDEHALVERSDLPDEIPIDGHLYQRFGLDEHGTAYFVAEAGTHFRVVETNEQFDILESTHIPFERLLGLIDYVDDEVGWRGLEGEWLDRAYAEDPEVSDDAE